MRPECRGQHHHPPCADCAIARVRDRPPRLQRRHRPRSFADLWGVLGVVMQLESSRAKRAFADERLRLRRRWHALPERYTSSRVFSTIIRSKADDLEELGRIVAKLEEMARRAGGSKPRGLARSEPSGKW